MRLEIVKFQEFERTALVDPPRILIITMAFKKEFRVKISLIMGAISYFARSRLYTDEPRFDVLCQEILEIFRGSHTFLYLLCIIKSDGC